METNSIEMWKHNWNLEVSENEIATFSGVHYGKVPELILFVLGAMCGSLGTKTKIKIADVGCGGDGFLKAFFAAIRLLDKLDDLKITTYAVDVSEDILNTIKKPVIPKLCPAENLDFKDGELDYYISCFTLLYVDDVPKMLDEMYRVLKEDGRAILLLWGKNTTLFKGAKKTEEWNQYTLEGWKETLYMIQTGNKSKNHAELLKKMPVKLRQRLRQHTRAWTQKKKRRKLILSQAEAEKEANIEISKLEKTDVFEKWLHEKIENAPQSQTEAEDIFKYSKMEIEASVEVPNKKGDLLAYGMILKKK